MGLTATGICSMLGASINVVPFMIQRNVPGIGPNVLAAFMLAAVPAVLAAMAYSTLAAAMPRAGGSYIYASRGLSPYLGFIASFSQWFGLSIVIGVIAYIIVPFLRDIAMGLNAPGLAQTLEHGPTRVAIALLLIWTFVHVNVRGARSYQRTLIPLMLLMFGLGGIVIVAGFGHDHADFAQRLLEKEGRIHQPGAAVPFDWAVFFSAAALLFSSFIGFDSIAQAGGEARNPTRSLPLAIGLAVVIVGSFYFLFTAAVYHAVPWTFVAQEAMTRDISAPGMLSYLLPPGLSVAILAGAAIALINDLPAMLLAVSRLMFAWAEDRIFPAQIARVHPRFHTPHLALIASGFIASVGVLGSHFAGDFFLGIDIMVTAMMVNFLLMCLTLVTLQRVNPRLAADATLLRSARAQRTLGWAGTLVLTCFLAIHVHKDLTKPVEAWYFHSSLVWLLVMGLGSVLYVAKLTALKKSGTDVKALFERLPPQ